MDNDGENQHQLIPPTSGDYAPIVSPDGTQITFVHAEDGNLNIWVMEDDGSDAHPLTTVEGETLSPAWSPDGTEIAYAQRLIGENGYTLVVMGVDGEEKTATSTWLSASVGLAAAGHWRSCGLVSRWSMAAF